MSSNPQLANHSDLAGAAEVRCQYYVCMYIHTARQLSQPPNPSRILLSRSREVPRSWYAFAPRTASSTLGPGFAVFICLPVSGGGAAGERMFPGRALANGHPARQLQSAARQAGLTAPAPPGKAPARAPSPSGARKPSRYRAAARPPLQTLPRTRRIRRCFCSWARGAKQKGVSRVCGRNSGRRSANMVH